MANSSRSRAFFITINKGANCYDNALDILNELNIKIYALITHDKDTDKESGELKAEHKHIVLELQNPITFNSIQNKFLGAHIEIVKNKKSTYQYLIHSTHQSREKYQYMLKDIITNNFEYVKDIIESEVKEPFLENRALFYIAEGITNYYLFFVRFGLEQCSRWWRSYDRLLTEWNTNQDMQNEIKMLKLEIDGDLPF